MGGIALPPGERNRSVGARLPPTRRSVRSSALERLLSAKRAIYECGRDVLVRGLEGGWERLWRRLRQPRCNCYFGCRSKSACSTPHGHTSGTVGSGSVAGYRLTVSRRIRYPLRVACYRIKGRESRWILESGINPPWSCFYASLVTLTIIEHSTGG